MGRGNIHKVGRFTLFERDGVWHFRRGEFKKTTKERDLARAKKFVREFEKQVLTRNIEALENRESIRLSAFKRQFLEHSHKAHSHSYWSHFYYSLSEFERYLGPEKRLKSITRKDMDGFVVFCKNRYKSAVTANTRLRHLRIALHVAKSWELIDEVPGSKYLPEPEKPVRCLTDEEVFKLQDAAGDWAYVINLALFTGFRRETLLDLDWSDIDFEKRTIKYRQFKTRREMVQPLGDPLLDDLYCEWGNQGYAESGPVIPMKAEDPGRAFTQRIRYIGKKAGVPVSPHVFRKTFGSWLRKSGVRMEVTRDLMGHKDLKTTMKYYVSVDESDLQAGINALSNRGNKNGTVKYARPKVVNSIELL